MSPTQEGADRHHPRVALIQLRCEPGEHERNLERAERAVAALAGRADLACLAETVDLGYDPEGLGARMVELAEPVPGAVSERLAAAARSAGVALVAGVVERDAEVPELLYDSALLLASDGTLRGCYRKTHLYPSEHAWFGTGDALPVFELAGLRVGVAICFEHAFPAIASSLARAGAQLIVNPSAVPQGYTYLQDLRTRARAQDNQLFFAAINHVGAEGNRVFGGGSQLADPRGEVLVRAADDAEETVIATLDLGAITRERLQEPVLRGFRPELYRW